MSKRCSSERGSPRLWHFWQRELATHPYGIIQPSTLHLFSYRARYAHTYRRSPTHFLVTPCTASCSHARTHALYTHAHVHARTHTNTHARATCAHAHTNTHKHTRVCTHALRLACVGALGSHTAALHSAATPGPCPGPARGAGHTNLSEP